MRSLLHPTPRVEVVAAANVDSARAEAFAKKHGIAKAFGSLDEALAWGKFDAVSNVTRFRTSPDLDEGDRRQEAYSLREASCRVLSSREGNGRCGGEGGADQHGRSQLPQCGGAARSAAADRPGASSARSAMSRRPTGRAGSPASTGATGRRSPPGCGGSPKSMARRACWAMSAFTSSISLPMRPA